MLKVQKFLETHTIEKLAEKYDIIVTEYDNYVTLNYSQIDSPKRSPIEIGRAHV